MPFEPVGDSGRYNDNDNGRLPILFAVIISIDIPHPSGVGSTISHALKRVYFATVNGVAEFIVRSGLDPLNTGRYIVVGPAGEISQVEIIDKCKAVPPRLTFPLRP